MSIEKPKHGTEVLVMTEQARTIGGIVGISEVAEKIQPTIPTQPEHAALANQLTAFAIGTPYATGSADTSYDAYYARHGDVDPMEYFNNPGIHIS